MPSDAFDLLDGPVAALVRDLPDALAPVTLTSPGGRSLPLFSTFEGAKAHLDELSPGAESPPVTVLAIAPNDPRAKEEVLRAATTVGARLVAFDPGPNLEPASTLDIELALGHLEAAKRNAACL